MRRLIFTLAILFASPVHAQNVPNPAQFVEAAGQLARAVEGGQALQIWDNASSVMKQATPRVLFASTASQRLSQNGPIQGRDWTSVMRDRVAQGQGGIAAGDYLTIKFSGVNMRGTKISETISFILDTDNVWRLAGYAVQ